MREETFKIGARSGRMFSVDGASPVRPRFFDDEDDLARGRMIARLFARKPAVAMTTRRSSDGAAHVLSITTTAAARDAAD